MVHVTKTNFLTQLADFLHHLPRASFVAIDEEMTGINLPPPPPTNNADSSSQLRGRRPNKIELPGERYARLLKGVPERYSMLQVGVALFCEEEKEGGDAKEKERNADDDRDGTPEEDAEKRAADDEEEAERGDESDDAAAANNNGASEQRRSSEYSARIYNFYLFPEGNRRSPEREVTLNPSTIKFLLENHMDFDKVFREGIPYTTKERAERLVRRHFERHDDDGEEKDGENNAKDSAEKKEKNGDAPAAATPKKNRVKLTRVEDIAFVARTMAGLREWIDADDSSSAAARNDPPGTAAAAGGEAAANANGGTNDGETAPDGSSSSSEGSSLVLPPCNAFLRRCLYETIEDEYPGLVLERASSDPAAMPARNQIRAIRLSPAEKKKRKDRMRQDAWDKLLSRELGFATVFRAISDACNGRAFSEERTRSFLDGLSAELSAPPAAGMERKTPLVVHNGLMDLMFLLTHCHDPVLPESFEDTKDIVRDYFPIVYDTKVLSTEYSDAIVRSGNTALGDLFDTTCNDVGDNAPSSLEVTPIANQDGRSQGQAHEAAWDAYMTGCVFRSLCGRILESENGPVAADATALDLDGLLHRSSSDVARERIGRNKIYMHSSLYTIDLESSSGPASGVPDPLSSDLSADTTFRVSGAAVASVSTRDMLQALVAAGNESEEPAVRDLRYEIIWVDDETFFVGTRRADDVDAVVAAEDPDSRGVIASHVRNGLRATLGSDVEISSLGDYLRNEYGNAAEDAATTPSKSGGIVGSLVSAAISPFAALGRALSYGKRESEDDDSDGEGGGKRRKLA